MKRAKKSAAISPNYLECSHCWNKGHRYKRECPDKHRSHEELVAEGMARSQARRDAIQRVTDAIAALPPDERVRLTVYAFNNALSTARTAITFAMMDRDIAEENQLKATLEAVR